MNITILGAGQLGGSIALALREAGHDCVITVYDPNQAHSAYLLEQDAVDYVATSAAEAVQEADLVLLACPLGNYRALAQEIAPALEAGTLVSDVGSVKYPMTEIAPLLARARVLGGHPIAGSEKAGPEAARADLFAKRLFILTPSDPLDEEALHILETFWSGLGADVIQMPVGVHDQIYAYVSHLPHYIAFVAAAYLFQTGVAVTPEDTVLQQFLRVSRSNARMWTDIALANREALLPSFATYIALLEHFATELRAAEHAKTTADTHAVAKHLLPRILAASLISSVTLYEQQSGMSLRPFGAGGMRDIVAPAAITPEADTEAISEVAHAVADHLDAIIPMFRSLEALIGSVDANGLYATLSQMSEEAALLTTVRN